MGDPIPRTEYVMPRPTAAQVTYGSATAVLCTLAMLLLTQTSSVVGVAVIALAALGLGLVVALTVPPSSTGSSAAAPHGSEAAGPAGDRTPAVTSASGSEARTPVRHAAAHGRAARAQRGAVRLKRY